MKKKGLFKRAMALLMVCVVSAGGVSATVLAAGDGETAASDAAETAYVLMNIPYADFYKAETGSNTVGVDAMSSATKNKPRTGTLAGGSYHVNADGSDISGVTFPVMLGEGVTLNDFAGYTEITDESSVDITVTNRGQTTTTTYSGEDALFESGNYSYYRLSKAPSYYKVVTKEGDKLVFGTTVGDVTTLDNVKAEFKTESSYGDYQLDLADEVLDSVDKVYGVVLGTEEGFGYGLRHVENIWRISKLAWCTGFTAKVHNCLTSSDHYVSMMGKKINKVTYYTSEGIYEIPLSESIYVPVKFENGLSVEDAAAAAGKTAFSTGTFPDGFEAVYKVEGLDGAAVNGMELTFPTNAAIGKYTMTVSDRQGVYADISKTFTLYTESIPVSYNNAQKALASGDADALAAYVKSITSVSVDGKAYAASGRGATVLINKDGTLALDAKPFQTEADSYKVEVTATGYKNNLIFTYAKVKADELKAAIDSAKSLKETDYTADTWKILKDKLAQAERVYEEQDSQVDIDKAAAELKTAVGQLVKAAADGGNGEKVKAGNIEKVGKLQYKVTKAAADGTGTVEVYAPVNKKAATLSVPKEVTIDKASYKVTAIGAKAFSKCTKLKKITIGANVTTIGKNAFHGDRKLKSIIIKTKKLSNVGKSAFKGISAKAVIKVPKAKRAAYKKLLKGKGQGKKVTIR